MFYGLWYKYVLYKYSLYTGILFIKLGSNVHSPTQHVISSFMDAPASADCGVCISSSAYVVWITSPRVCLLHWIEHSLNTWILLTRTSVESYVIWALSMTQNVCGVSGIRTLSGCGHCNAWNQQTSRRLYLGHKVDKLLPDICPLTMYLNNQSYKTTP